MNEDEAALAGYAEALATAIDHALPGWVERSVARRLPEPSAEVRSAATEAGRRARSELGSQIRELLALDIDRQPTNPLEMLRRGVRYATEVLVGAGAPPVERDAFAERNFPDDRFDLTPASFADVDPALHIPGLEWGAAKAHVHLQRRRADGQR
ncbi:MAG: hypothetical protein HKN26_06570 [Acidimicrobiales bacterium]|nr:hypothetical protein [Acidimicrobiales bacterium]